VLLVIHCHFSVLFPSCAYDFIRCEANGEEHHAAASQPRASSSYGGNDYVDYGAYTGGQGAFGWYSDHPVGNGGSGSY